MNMEQNANNVEVRFGNLIEKQRHREAFEVFLEQVAGKSWQDLEGPDQPLLDQVCHRLLPELIQSHTLWLVDHPDHLRRMVELLTESLRVNYNRPTTLDQIAHLRCLLAIHQALAGQADRVHEELCLVQSGESAEPVPQPNGIFREKISPLELKEVSTAPFLAAFFAAYTEFLRRSGQHELANFLDSRLGRLLDLVARDEHRPGVVQALLFSHDQGYSRFVHVSLEQQANTDRDPGTEDGIIYAGRDQDHIDLVMKEAAALARQAVDAYLKKTGYPDGLAERLIRWELTTLKGDSTGPPQAYGGGSIGLPLAVAIISEYLPRPVPNDVALTGTFTDATVAGGQILPVDGIREKLEHALLSGSQLIYVPTGNLPEMEKRPGVQKLAAENSARIVPIEKLDQAGKELFPPEGSGRIRDILKDTIRNFHDIVRPTTRKLGLPPSAKPVHERHRYHILICSIITAAIVFLEGVAVYKVFAPSYPAVQAWGRIILATTLVFAGMGITFTLPAACLRHRRLWSWYVSIGLLLACFSAAEILLAPMLPEVNRISNLIQFPPAAGLMKDLFVFWCFAWPIAANTFNVVANLEALVTRRQFITARKCLHWDSLLEARQPIHCVYFPWKWGVVAIGVVVGVLLAADFQYYASLKPSPAAYWQMFLGLGRDLLILVAIAEVMLFYKRAVAAVRTALA